ncbi:MULTISPECIES: SUKH-4 family immunity protein [Actinomadura]|uniref:SUKH-4 family immunity protein n=1 Tax=Actinomadura yumaensis TaxID=111807 RepID=A0ABW2CGT1_9ACTN|nr:SUKH-4 family immunity protein [Actinomadura sp. J1-007]MWK34511.1 hypothetical protein [Actinomadura sp. J1-007]
MTTDITGELTAQFGPRGLRRFAAAELDGLQVPAGAAGPLAEAGLPIQVGPYFTATSGEPLPLGEYASSAGFPEAAASAAGWLRLGTDRGAELCVEPDGQVRALFVVADAPSMHVNASVPAFLRALLALDRHLPVLAAPGDQDPAAVFRGLRKRLLEVDEAALQDDEAWWPRVLEQIRHAMSFPFSAAFEVGDSRGGKRIETEQAAVGLAHPERVLWSRLERQGVRPEQVTRVYTELEPCFLPGNYCAMWLTKFTRAEFSHSFDYGDTAAEREAGLLDLMRYAAEQD